MSKPLSVLGKKPEISNKETPSGGMELPFFYFVSFVLAAIGGWAIYSTPVLQNPARAIPFGLLMILHIGLYWISWRLMKNPTHTLIYLVGQGLLALTLNLVGQNPMLSMGLYMGLVGITVGVFNLTRRGLLVIAFYMLLSMISYGVLTGWQDLHMWLLGTVPTLIFVIIYVTLYNRQTTERERAQKLAGELESANRQLSEYAEQVETLTLTNERQRMARELHDTLSQGLAGLILQLEAADAHLSANRTERARTIIQQTMTQARSTLASARRAIDDLRQTPGDLAEVLRQEVDRFTQATGIPCRLEMDLAVVPADELCEPVQRTLAEALTNIARHARASQVSVSVASREDGLRLTVQDNGVGFDPPTASTQPGHYGLLGIRERARLAGGTFDIQSTPGQGATLILHLPHAFGATHA